MALGYNGWASAAPISEYPFRERLMTIIGAENPAMRFGQGCLHEAIKLANPDIVISAFDAWMVSYLGKPHEDAVVKSNPQALEILALDSRNFTHIAYFPLDGLQDDKYLPRLMDEWVSGFDVPVTYSRYAQDAVLRSTGLHIPMIPIGHDPNVYCPGDKSEARERLQLPQDAFIVGMVATNQYRKRWDEFLAACGRARKYIPNLLVLPWTTWDQQIYGGFDITDLVVRYGLEKCTMNPKSVVGKFSDEQMADLYRAMDVNVLTTIGEGAGLPPLRARACGTPSLVSANTSNVEFAGHKYELLPCHPGYNDNNVALVRFSTDIEITASKIVELYHNENLRSEIGEAGIATMSEYALEKTCAAWDALLEMIA